MLLNQSKSYEIRYKYFIGIHWFFSDKITELLEHRWILCLGKRRVSTDNDALAKAGQKPASPPPTSENHDQIMPGEWMFLKLINLYWLFFYPTPLFIYKKNLILSRDVFHSVILDVFMGWGRWGTKAPVFFLLVNLNSLRPRCNI